MTRTRRFVLAASLLLPCAALAARGEYLVYFGTYTREPSTSKGIYAYRFDANTGELTDLGLAAEVQNPSFVAVHPDRRYLYSVSEVSMVDGERDGLVHAYSIDHKTGKLTHLNTVRSRGTAPCHLNVDATGRTLVVANYGSGTVSAFPIKADGSLGDAATTVQHQGKSVDPKRQQGPHAHSVNISKENTFVAVADLGLDQILIYKLNPAAATLTPNDPPFVAVEPGGGPRHFTFHPNGRFAYTNNEMGSSVTAFQWNARKGVLTKIHTVSTLPADFSGANHTAEVLVHPSGKFLYCSNRGHDSIAIFAIDAKTGRLTPRGHVSTQGKTPRNFNFDPTGRYMFVGNQNTHNVVLFRIDQTTGALTPAGKELQIGAPVCIRFVALD
jgi:6-phosphogluconolactonase